SALHDSIRLPCVILLVSLHVGVSSEWSQMARSMPAGHVAHLRFASTCNVRSDAVVSVFSTSGRRRGCYSHPHRATRRARGTSAPEYRENVQNQSLRGGDPAWSRR